MVSDKFLEQFEQSRKNIASWPVKIQKLCYYATASFPKPPDVEKFKKDEMINISEVVETWEVNEYGWRIAPKGIPWIVKGYRIRVGTGCFSGNNCTIGDLCVIGDLFVMGNNCRIADMCAIGNGCYINDWCILGTLCKLGNRVILGEDCDIGEKCFLNNKTILGDHSSIFEQSQT